MPASGRSNTRDKLRGAHPRTMVLGGSGTVAIAAYHAAPRLQPPLVSFIALLGGLAYLLYDERPAQDGEEQDFDHRVAEYVRLPAPAADFLCRKGMAPS